MGWARAALAVALAAAAGAVLVSGGTGADPRTPAGLPGLPPPFLGTAVVGSGGLTAAIDAYGDVVDLRAPGPAGRGLIDNPSDRQAAGTVPVDTGIVPRMRLGDGAAAPLWRAESVRQRYLPGTDVVVTVARFHGFRVVVEEAAEGELVLTMRVWPRGGRTAKLDVHLERPARCRRKEWENGLALVCGKSVQTLRSPERLIARAARGDRRWLRRALPLGAGAPAWAERLYERSLLVLRALTDRRTGAVAAGARDGWAYVWPRDAAAAALALDAAGYRGEAKKVAGFLLSLDLSAAARFRGDGAPVSGRGPQGDAAGWVAAAARSLGRSEGGLGGQQRGGSAETSLGSPPDLPDYQEKSSGDYLGNAIAEVDGQKTVPYGAKSARRREASLAQAFGTREGLVRRAGDPGSGLDSAAAWAVEPFRLRSLYPQARETMLRLARRGGRFGITPGTAWPGEDPWTAPTAWTAWSLAALSRQERGPSRAQTDRRVALRLLADLRRAASPTGSLPERVGARTGVPHSTTPLAWSHAFAILALLELWPPKQHPPPAPRRPASIPGWQAGRLMQFAGAES